MMNAWIEFASMPDTGSVATMLVIKSTLVVVLGLCLYFLMHRASPSARHAALSATLISVLLLPIISLAVAPLEITVSKSTLPHETVPIAAAERGVESTTATVETTFSSAPVEFRLPSADTALPPADAVLYFYLGGLVAVLGYMLIGMARVWRMTHKSSPSDIGQRCADLLPKLRRKRVRLLENSHIFAPITWGVIRPVVLMPTAANSWTDADVRSALEHELAHIDRKDWLFQIVASLVGALHWFNPLIWVAIRRLYQEAELAADNRVLNSGVQATDYASQLVSLARTGREPHMPVVAAAMAAKGFLGRRVKSILASSIARPEGSRLVNFSLSVTVLAVAVVIGGTQLVHASQDESPEQAAKSTHENTTPLIRAAAEGDNVEVQRLLGSGADVNEKSRNRDKSGLYQRTALTTAAAAGHADVVATLIAAGAPVDRKVRGDATALIEATRNGHMDVTKVLVEHGADVNKAALGDGSPLIGATQANDAEAVRYLLAAGADPNDSVMGDENPFYHASAHGNTEIMQMLIDAGVKVNQKWLGDGNALMLAVRSGDAGAVDLLVDAGVDPNQGVMGDGSAMIVAARSGDTAMLQKMIDAGGDVNKSFRGEGSPLIAAARYGNLGAVEVLVESGAEIDKVVKKEENALIAASWKGHLEVVDYLLNAGADPNINAPEGREPRTALRQARRSGHDDVVQRLIAGGATQ